MQNNNEKGKEGEEIAVRYLLKNGYKITDKNWRFRHLELDIIAILNKTLIIIEVKLRVSNTFGEPEDFVSLKKQKNLVNAAQAYIIEKNLDYETRFDIISIIHNSKETEIKHIVDAFYPTIK